MPTLPPRITTDAGEGYTLLGLQWWLLRYSKSAMPRVAAPWRHWTLWLLASLELLAREGKQDHADQVAMWLIIHMSQIPFVPAPSNITTLFTLPWSIATLTRNVRLL
jgi:hypothetical protein